MNIEYDDTKDLLYIRFDGRKQEIINQRISEYIVLDIGEGEKVVGIEILDASKCLDLEKILPIKYNLPEKVTV